MSTRRRHPNKDIEAALRYAESKGWRVELAGAHAWGRILCPERSRNGHIKSIWSTPRNPTRHARDIRAEVDACEHRPTAGE